MSDKDAIRKLAFVIHNEAILEAVAMYNKLRERLSEEEALTKTLNYFMNKEPV